MAKLIRAEFKQRGQALAEYLIVTGMLTVMVWYALVGGSVDATGNGGLYETDVNHQASGNLLERRHSNVQSAPGLIQALHDKQERFREAIYEP